jgi:hypothetical protein
LNKYQKIAKKFLYILPPLPVCGQGLDKFLKIWYDKSKEGKIPIQYMRYKPAIGAGVSTDHR